MITGNYTNPLFQILELLRVWVASFYHPDNTSQIPSALATSGLANHGKVVITLFHLSVWNISNIVQSINKNSHKKLTHKCDQSQLNAQFLWCPLTKNVRIKLPLSVYHIPSKLPKQVNTTGMLWAKMYAIKLKCMIYDILWHGILVYIFCILILF